MPRMSSLDGFFLGGEGFADTSVGSRNAIFASTEFAIQIGHNRDWTRSLYVVVSTPKQLMKSVGMIHGL